MVYLNRQLSMSQFIQNKFLLHTAFINFRKQDLSFQLSSLTLLMYLSTALRTLIIPIKRNENLRFFSLKKGVKGSERADEPSSPGPTWG